MRSLSTAMMVMFTLSACGVDPLKPTVEFSGSNNAGGKKPTPSKQLYVDLSAEKNGNGTKDSPFQTIQSAIQAATADTEVRIAAGQYQESITLKAGVSLKGGFSASDWNTNDPDKYMTVITNPSHKGGSNIDQPAATINIVSSSKPLMISNMTIQGADVDGDATTSDQYNETSSAIFAKSSSQFFLENVKVNGGNRGKYTTGLTLINTSAEMTKSQVKGGKGLNSYGVYVSGTSTIFANKNNFEATGATSSIGFFSSSQNPLHIRGNHFKGGQGGTLCYGMLLYAPATGVSLLGNNVVTEATCSSKNIGMELRGDNVRKGQLHVRNNTVTPISQSNTAFAAAISLTTISEAIVEITNNMLLDYGDGLESACIYENDTNSAPYLVRNNNLFGCNHLYRRFDGVSSYHDTINALQNETAFDASHNKALNPQLDSTYKFTGSPSTELTHGGIDGKLEDWTFIDDRDGDTRTDDKNGIGWTIGAYEFD